MAAVVGAGGGDVGASEETGGVHGGGYDHRDVEGRSFIDVQPPAESMEPAPFKFNRFVVRNSLI